MNLPERLRELEKQATDAAWYGYHAVVGRTPTAQGIRVAQCHLDADAALIAEMRNALPRLLDVAEEAKSHSCYMHGVGSGPREARQTDCRMCAALARLDEKDAR